MSLSHSFAPVLIFLLPAFAMVYIAAEIYLRHPKHSSNRAAAQFILCFALILTALYLTMVMPMEHARQLHFVLIEPLAFLSAGLGMRFYLRITRLETGIPRLVRGLLYFSPALAAFVLLQMSGSLLADVVELPSGWRFAVYGRVFTVMVSSLLLYTVSGTLLLLYARRTAGSERARAMYAILLANGIFSILWGFGIALVSCLSVELSWTVSLAFHCTIVWAVTVRYVVLKYDFLPHYSRKFEKLFNLSPFGIMLLDEHASIREMNPSARGMMIANGGDGTESSVLDVLPAGHRSAALARYRQRFAAPEGEKDLEFSMLDVRGELSTVVVESEFLEVDGERLMLLIIRNVTEEKLRMEEHLEAKERYRNLAELLEIVSRTTNDGIWEYHVATNRIRWGLAGGGKALGGSVPEMSLNEFMALIHPEEREAVREICESHKLRGTPFECEFRLLRGEDTYIWVYCAAEAARDDQGQPLRLIGSIKDITERRSAQEEITYLAYHDALTGLPNRLLFHKHLTERLQDAQQRGQGTALLLLDLDQFKLINESLGHRTGDVLLQSAAVELRGVLRPGDLAARMGGDEFAVLLEAVTCREEAISAAEAILARFRQPLRVGDLELFSTASIGIAYCQEKEGDADLLIRGADMAMYAAKEQGRDRAALYVEGMTDRASERLELENGLRRALERGEFVLHYQPQTDASSGALVGMEALIRWESPDRGRVAPDRFIPIAEESGLITQIGSWVLRTACEQNQAWQEQGLPRVTVSVNISVLQLKRRPFVEEVRDILEKTGLQPQYLCLEVTESVAFRDEAILEVLQQLTALGIRIAIDDFGTGYSSLSMLDRMPVHVLKIDRSFISGLPAQPSSVVHAMISMAHHMKLSVVAEGVETEGQLQLLQQLGCDEIQGYYVSPPVPSADFERFMTGLHAGSAQGEKGGGQ
ncbi:MULTISPECIES: EAL domain-containing protein [Paenibacillus]|uniref:EAL domain-containing protein n=1 Tax=Paenibacillus TaxID=44249 RepID=UPI0022B89DC0|nr:EAL domain-containing protein [Paenibacillus caseinilyticus]MCZ8522580.1 EAL domain-containing protein [Paenibacillus caseinilyticus]